MRQALACFRKAVELVYKSPDTTEAFPTLTEQLPPIVRRELNQREFWQDPASSNDEDTDSVDEPEPIVPISKKPILKPLLPILIDLMNNCSSQKE